jgi:DNA-binding XRE family transcriptional regulator
MNSIEFAQFRKRLNKTQKELSQLLGISLKAIHSYEQGWRKIPPHVERQMFFLAKSIQDGHQQGKDCWTIKKCPSQVKKNCPAWEFQSGNLCWFICGTRCASEIQGNWEEKMKICRSCEVLKPILQSVGEKRAK